MKRLHVWPCKDIDFSWTDVGYAVRMCLTIFPERRQKSEVPIQANGDSLFCLSVRAAFDLYLNARSWQDGDECIFVGVNVPDMIRIAESHDLRVRGVDMDPITTMVELSQLEANINPRTRFIVVAHLFGHRLDLRQVIDLASRYGLDVIEDCAQAFAGRSWWGTRGVTLSLFSFGPMKTATALQGAVAVVRDAALFEMMASKLTTYPVQPTWRYFLRIVRFGSMKVATQPLIYGVLFRLMRMLRINHENVIHASTKSASGKLFQRWLRTQPCTALIRVIERQICSSDADLKLRISKGSSLHAAIGEGVSLVVRDQHPNVFWMVPVLVDDPESFKNVLRSSGFDAVSGRLATVNCEDTKGAKRLSSAVMLPFSPQMSDKDLQRIGIVATKYHAGSTNSVEFDHRDLSN